MQVKVLALRLKRLPRGTQLQDWDAKREDVLGFLSVAIRRCYSELLTLRLEHLCHFDFSWERESLECMPGLTCEGEPLLKCIWMCQHLRRLHISTTFLPEMISKFMDIIGTVIRLKSPNLAILEWRHFDTHRVGPDFFSEEFFQAITASKIRGLQLLQLDDCNFVSEKGVILPSSLRFLALHNFEVPFAGELASAVAGLPHLEELYLAPFRVPADQPFSFTKLWPSVQILHTLVLDVISEGGFEAPGDMMELPNLQILVIEDLSMTLPPLNLRCPKLTTLAASIDGRSDWGIYFSRLPLPPGLVNLQVKLQAELPDASQVPIFWAALGGVRSLRRLKAVFDAFDVESAHQSAAMFLGFAHMAKCTWPSLQELGLYMSSCSCCSKQPCFTISAAGVLFYAPLGVNHALEGVWRKMVCPALNQVWLYPVMVYPQHNPGAVHAPAEPALYAGKLAYTQSPGLSVTALEAPGHEIRKTRWRTMGGPEEADAIHRALCSLDCEIRDIGGDEGLGNGDAANQDAGNDDAANHDAGNGDAANVEAGNDDAANHDAGNGDAANQEAEVGVAADQDSDGVNQGA
ncbi:g4365 [Coccomyxa elongata]